MIVAACGERDASELTTGAPTVANCIEGWTKPMEREKTGTAAELGGAIGTVAIVGAGKLGEAFVHLRDLFA